METNFKLHKIFSNICFILSSEKLFCGLKVILNDADADFFDKKTYQVFLQFSCVIQVGQVLRLNPDVLHVLHWQFQKW